MKYSQPYRDCVAIQRKMMQLLPTVGTKDIANMAKGYVSLETMKLRLRMKPAPKPVDVEKLQSAKRSKSRGRVMASED